MAHPPAGGSKPRLIEHGSEPCGIVENGCSTYRHSWTVTDGLTVVYRLDGLFGSWLRWDDTLDAVIQAVFRGSRTGAEVNWGGRGHRRHRQHQDGPGPHAGAAGEGGVPEASGALADAARPQRPGRRGGAGAAGGQQRDQVDHGGGHRERGQGEGDRRHDERPGPPHPGHRPPLAGAAGRMGTGGGRLQGRRSATACSGMVTTASSTAGTR